MRGGTRNNGREETGSLDVTVPGELTVEALGRHEKPLPLIGRVLGHTQFNGERERWGGGEVGRI